MAAQPGEFPPPGSEETLADLLARGQAAGRGDAPPPEVPPKQPTFPPLYVQPADDWMVTEGGVEQ
jgi:hypothetical protein